jgi:uncharacterized protein (DUF1015 family)
MAQIRPFRALRYDPARVPISLVATQPYDKITPEMQERYYAASPHNLVRIILGKRFATDDTNTNTYTRAAGFFSDWRRQGVFLQDAEPSIYRYSQTFTAPDSKTQLDREGYIAIGKLEDYSAGVIFRHEQTLSKPKADRLELLRATRAHFGQIFMLYSDPTQEIERALSSSSEASTPDLELSDEYGVLHRVWRVSQPEAIAFVQGAMEDKKLIIADGHHRYETALNYRNENPSARTSQSDSSLYEYVMMTLVNMDSPGLLILPTHRVVHGLASLSMESFRGAATPFFTVDEVDPVLDTRRATAILREAGHTGTALLAVARDRVFLLSRAKSPDFAFEGISLRQQGLDVVQLHRCLLERGLGISEDAIRNQTNVSYVRDISEAMSLVREGKADIAFLMNPVRMQQVRDIAFSGEVLPQKSTDFYPKLLDGLTVYALD